MKKLIFLFTVIIGLSFWILPISTNAATTSTISPEEAAAMVSKLEALKTQLLNLQIKGAQQPTVTPKTASTLDPQEAALIKQNLDKLQVALNALKTSVNNSPQPIANAAEISQSLAVMKSYLISLDNSLNRFDGAPTPQVFATQKTTPSVTAPQNQPASTNVPTEIAANEPTVETLAANNEENKTNEEITAAGSSFNLNTVPRWAIGVGILIIIAVIWFLRMRIKPSEKKPVGTASQNA